MWQLPRTSDFVPVAVRPPWTRGLFKTPFRHRGWRRLNATNHGGGPRPKSLLLLFLLPNQQSGGKGRGEGRYSGKSEGAGNYFAQYLDNFRSREEHTYTY